MRKILRGHVFNIRFLFTLCLGFSFLFEAHAQVSGTYTINSAVATGGSNFQTFSAAAAFLSGGVNGPVTFNVQAGSGPYNEQVLLNNISGTSSVNTITFNCNGVTLTFLSTNANERACVKLNNTDYVTFDNLTVRPLAAVAGEYGYGFHLLNDADNNKITNCRITTNVNQSIGDNLEGIVINGNNGNSTDPGYSNCDDNLIQGNTISGGHVGVSLSSIPVTGDPVQFMNRNRIEKNAITNTLYYGIRLVYTSGTVIDGNNITGGPDAVYGLTGVYANLFNQSFSITNNRIHAFRAVSGKRLYGINITSLSVSGKECLIANNLIYDLRCDFSQYGIASRTGLPALPLSASYLKVYHNTISLDDQVESGQETFGLLFENVTDMDVANNIVSISRKAINWNWGIYLEKTPERFTANRNVYFIPDGNANICGVGFINTEEKIELSEWQSTGYDLFSNDLDPAFVNLAAFDFKPTSQGIDNMGVFVGVNTDITGATRSNSMPDPGCFEFVSSPCSSPIIAGTTYVAPDSILCLGPRISLGLRNNSAGSTQTYIWQTSTTLNGSYTNVTGALGYPAYEVTPTTTYYYRVAITCGATTTYSSPIRVLVNQTSLNAGTYTINSALPTGGINFTSFRDAILALQCGFNGTIVFNVASGSGPYYEQITVPALNTSPTRTITFNGNGTTLEFEPTDPVQSAVIKLDGADYITFDSLNINVLPNKDEYGWGVQIMNDADHNTIKRCTVNVNKGSTSPIYAGIVMSASHTDPIFQTANNNCDTNLIAGNTINGGFYGITSADKNDQPGVANAVGNIIRNNLVKDACRAGIYLSGNSFAVVDSNDISHPNRTVFSPEAFLGIYAYKSNFGLTITRNKIHNLLEKVKTAVVQLDGINLNITPPPPAAYPNLVSNNIVYNFYGNGVQQGIYALSPKYLKLYHNTFVLDDTAAVPPGVTYATRGIGMFGAVSTGTLVQIMNNNVVVKRGGNSPKYCIQIALADSNIKANYNNYYLLAAQGTSNFVGRMGTKDYLTLSNWLATRKDSATISMDPVFNDLSTGDLSPTKIPFENKGTNVGIAADIWNVSRSTSTPDIGAFEFTICKPLTTPVLTLDSAGVHVIRFKWTAVQNTLGYRVSTDSVNWTIPTSGALGLTHTITGLKPTDKVRLLVKALGARADCPEIYSQWASGQTLSDGLFIPNTFTPNGNGQNDVFKVYTNMMSSVHWMVFNQWGEKVFETTDMQGFWDGNYKGKPQPVGVYVYVVVGTLPDGSKVTQKGTFNLVR